MATIRAPRPSGLLYPRILAAGTLRGSGVAVCLLFTASSITAAGRVRGCVRRQPACSSKLDPRSYMYDDHDGVP
jgi:hypothetical protein